MLFRLRHFASVLAILFSTTAANAIPPFDEARDAANDIIARAEQAGNALLLQLGRQILSSIDAMEQSALQLIEAGEDAALVIEGELFRDINDTLGRLEETQDIATNDLNQLTANWASLVSRLPFVDATAEVMAYRPRVVLPIGSDEVPVTMVGPGLAEAVLRAEFNGSEDIQINLASDNELVILLPRSRFGEPSNDLSFHTLIVEIDVTPPVTWRPRTWFAEETVTRELTFMLMPEHVASYRIEPVVAWEETQRRIYTGTTNARGKDSEVTRTIEVPPDLAEAGWLFDTETIRNGTRGVDWVHERTDDRGGSSCTGIHFDSLSGEAVVFRHQIGHINGGAFAPDSDGWVNCDVRLPMIRQVPREAAGEPIEGSVPMNRDVEENMPENTASYRIHVTLFDGRSYIVQDDGGLPFSPVVVEHSTETVLFRPRPPRDF
ncbi:hypothetical protein N0B44_00015 [Roseibacterium beibuensis]|uniref:Uncharacterized protein n=1 Tax=[Roseibacterium] beibuensis TaxID=1193142 RepID=A0ABP9L613_9RHOB|nr:hypothetical protein [Roseibacterium beibuensis]MCS6621284.1 hypothetical protein [Roseibacterium beibuensis]